MLTTAETRDLCVGLRVAAERCFCSSRKEGSRQEDTGKKVSDQEAVTQTDSTQRFHDHEESTSKDGTGSQEDSFSTNKEDCHHEEDD
jgi:hypothetical protein